MNEHDEMLALFTDQVLAGELKSKEESLTPEQEMVIKLHRLVSPDATIEPAFRQRVMRQMMDEFDQGRTQRRTQSSRRIINWRTSPQLIGGLAAAVMVILVGGILLLSGQENSSADEVSGTTPLATTEALIVLLIFGVLSALTYWIWSRRR